MNNKRVLIWFLIILIILGIIIRFATINKDFMGEEVDFVKPALSIKNIGHPFYYNSERNPNGIALWHPPMYIFLLSLVFRIGFNEISARSVNIFFSIFTAILIYIFCVNIIRKEKGKIIGLISSAFFMINYYIFSSSIIIDIDILSMFFIFFFVYSILRYHQTKKKIYFYLSVTFLFFSIANRYPITFLVYIGIGIYYYLNKEFKKEFKDYLKIGFIAVIGFLIVWGFYSIIIEPGNFFTFISHNIKLGGEQISNFKVYIGSFVLNIAQFIRLFTFPAFLLMLWSILYFWRSKSHLIRILMIYSLGTLIFFSVLPRPAFGYSRYFASIFPGLSILIGIFLYTNLKKVDFKSEKKGIYIVLISFIVSLMLLLILSPQATIYSSAGLIKATNLPDFIMNIFASLPILFIFQFKKEKRRVFFILILIALILSYSLYFNIKFIAHNSQIKQTGNYIKENTNEEEVIISPKSIGYYSERKFHINSNNKPLLDFSFDYLKEYIEKSWENPEMDDEFFWPKGFYFGLYPPLPNESELRKSSYVVLYHPVEGFDLEKKIGDFYIYNLEQLGI